MFTFWMIPLGDTVLIASCISLERGASASTGGIKCSILMLLA